MLTLRLAAEAVFLCFFAVGIVVFGVILLRETVVATIPGRRRRRRRVRRTRILVCFHCLVGWALCRVLDLLLLLSCILIWTRQFSEAQPGGLSRKKDTEKALSDIVEGTGIIVVRGQRGELF